MSPVLWPCSTYGVFVCYVLLSVSLCFVCQVLLNGKVVEDSHNTGEEGATEKQPLMVVTGKGAVIPGKFPKRGTTATQSISSSILRLSGPEAELTCIIYIYIDSLCQIIISISMSSTQSKMCWFFVYTLMHLFSSIGLEFGVLGMCVG